MILADRLHGELATELHIESCSGESILQASFDTTGEECRRDNWFNAKRH